MPIVSSPQSVQTQGVSAIAASNTTYITGQVEFTGSGAATIQSSANQRVVVNVPVQSVQVVQSALAASNTTYTSGAVTITGVGGGVTVSSNTGQRIDISVAAPVAQTAQTGISGIAGSNTTYTSGTVTITGVGGGVTVSSNTGQRIDISVAAPINFSAGASNLGNTAGATGVSGTQLVLVGTNGVTLSQTTGANGATISISANGAGGGVAIAASNTTFTSGTVLWSVSDGSRSALSYSSGAQSVILTDFGPQLAWFRRGAPITTAGALGVSNLVIFPLVPNGDRFPGRMTASVFRVPISFNQSASSSISAALSSTMDVFVYTRTSDSLSLLNSGSMSFGNTVATSNNSTNWTGIRFLDITATSAWSVRPDFLYGAEYYIAIGWRTHITVGVAANGPKYLDIAGGSTLANIGSFGVAANLSDQHAPFMGTISRTATNHIMTTIARSAISGAQGNNNDPHIQIYENTIIK